MHFKSFCEIIISAQPCERYQYYYKLAGWPVFSNEIKIQYFTILSRIIVIFRIPSPLLLVHVHYVLVFYISNQKSPATLGPAISKTNGQAPLRLLMRSYIYWRKNALWKMPSNCMRWAYFDFMWLSGERWTKYEKKKIIIKLFNNQVFI